MALFQSCISHDVEGVKRKLGSLDQQLAVAQDVASLQPELDVLDKGLAEGEPKPPDCNTSVKTCKGESCKPLDWDLFFACAEGSPDRTKASLESGADVNVRDYEGRRPLHVASGRGHVSVVRMLLAASAEVNVFDCSGLSPLDRAKQANQKAIQRLLIKHGANHSKERLSYQSEREKWEINRKDVFLGDELSRTLKSVVYRGTWTGIDVVAKFCIDASRDDPEDPEEELLHEIELLASVRHPDLVMFLGCSLKESPLMFITQYMPGGDLERYYRRKSEKTHSRWCPDLKTVTRWASQILRALHFLHTCSDPIIHRDLKPLNILLTDTLDVKVGDFGISKITDTMKEQKPGRRTSTRSRAASLTSAQSTYVMTGGVGSFRYMAPEVARHEAYTEKVDIFSFALILYFMSSGRQPFCDFRDPMEILQQYSLGNEPRPKAADCHSSLRMMIQSAWHSEPWCRPSAVDLLQDITDVQQAHCTSICRSM